MHARERRAAARRGFHPGIGTDPRPAEPAAGSLQQEFAGEGAISGNCESEGSSQTSDNEEAK
jgi:hypothetical protein